ncbi:MAG: flagellar protein FlgN [bacterium]
MKEIIDQLVEKIRQEERILEEFLQSLLRQRECIVENRLEEFEEVVPLQDHLLEEIRAMEKERMELIKSITQIAGTTDEISLTRLVEMNLGETSEELRRLKTTLSRLIDQVKKANRVNQHLIRRSLTFIERNLDQFIDEGEGGLVYLPDGKRKPRGIPHLLVDRRL